jgi:hypothetical protein
MSDLDPETNHVMFTKIPSVNSGQEQNWTTYYKSYKEAHDAGTEIIQNNPSAECDIFQIRARLRGKIEVISKEFNSQKTA